MLPDPRIFLFFYVVFSVILCQFELSTRERKSEEIQNTIPDSSCMLIPSVKMGE